MKSSTIRVVVRSANIITAVMLIVFSVLSLGIGTLNALTTLKIFLIFSPVFMALLGVCLLAAEFKVKFIIKRMKFLKSMCGRAALNFFLSSVVYYYFSSPLNNNEVLAWIGGLSLFISGLFYVGLHFGWGKKIADADEPLGEDDDTEETKEEKDSYTKKIRQNLI